MKKLSNTETELKKALLVKKSVQIIKKCYHKKSYNEKQKEPGTSYQSHFKLPDIFRSFLSLEMLQFNKIKQVFVLFKKNAIYNLCRPVHDIIVVPFSNSS